MSEKERLAVRARLGKITRVQFNVVYLVEEGERGKQYAFTLDKIESYRGEYFRELKQFGRRGLSEGVLVKFFADDEGRVTLVRPLAFTE